MNKKSIKKEIYSTLKKNIIESFQIIPKKNLIKKILKEQEMPFSFEVPFVLDDDLDIIIGEIKKIEPQIEGKYVLFFKDDSNTLEVRSADQTTHEILQSLVNNVQLNGPTGVGEIPLGAQPVEEEEKNVKIENEPLAAQIDAIINTPVSICPLCGEIQTKTLGENVAYCPSCYNLWERKNQVDEDMLIDPEKEKGIEGDKPEEKQPKNAPVKAVVEKKKKYKNVKI